MARFCQWLGALTAVACCASCSAGRSAARPESVAFGELVTRPERYQGRQVCTDGFRASGFETNALAASIDERGGASYLSEPAIWLEGASIGSERDCFTTKTSPPARFCRVTACGRFQSGASFGAGGNYRFQLVR